MRNGLNMRRADIDRGAPYAVTANPGGVAGRVIPERVRSATDFENKGEVGA